MDKGAGLSVGGISKIASSNKKITLRDCILECDFFAVCGCLCGPKTFPLIDQSVGQCVGRNPAYLLSSDEILP